MRRGPKVLRWTVGLAAISLTPFLLAATPAEQLDQAVQLFQKGEYDGARRALLEVDKSQLSAEENQRRSELLDEIGAAVNQSNRARQNLDDADKAFDSNDRAAAEQLFQAVLDNNYASAAQKQRAKQGLALLARQRDLEQQLDEATTRPAGAPATRPAERRRVATRPAPLTGRGADRGEVTRLIQAGDEAMARGQYDLAEQRFQQALRMTPNHPEALRGLQLVREHRAAEGTSSLIGTQEEISRARWERAKRLYRQSENEIRSLINNKAFEEARQRLAAARGLLDAARPDARPPEQYEMLVRSLESLARYIESEQRAAEADAASVQRRAALEAERRRVEQDIRERDERIVQLMMQAATLRKEKQYEKSADVLREILAIDPNYDKAMFMLEVMEDTHMIKRQKEGRKFHVNQQQKAMIESSRALAPEVVGDDEIYAFPPEDQWRIISQRDPYGAGATGEKPEDRIAEQQLDQLIPEVVFPEGSTFEDVIEFLRSKGKLSIDVNWNALSLVGIDRTATLTLNLHSVKLRTALELTLENVGAVSGVQLGYDVLDGIIRVSTVEELSRKTISRVYDVQDLLVQIRSFKAPSQSQGGGLGGGLQLGGGGGGFGGGGLGGGGGGFGGGGGGGFGGGGGGGGGLGGGGGGDDDDDDSSEEDRQQRIEDLEEMIKNLIEPGTWEEDGAGGVGSLQIWNDRMIVRHTASVHRQLVDLFRQLRETKDIQVSIEARFITMTSNFLEEIGIDLDVVLNQGNAGYDSFIDANGNRLRDPITGGTLLQPRQFSQLGFTPAIPGFGVPIAQTAFPQPYGNVALVPQGHPNQWYQSHTTPFPIINNTIDMATPRTTGVPGSLEGYSSAAPAFQMMGSFLDNIQLDFLMRATQLDVRSSNVEAPRLVVFNNREGYIRVGSNQSFIFQPGFLPVGGGGVAGSAASGQNPTIGFGFSGRTLSVLPTVSADRKYVTLQLTPRVERFSTQNVVSALGPLQLSRIDETTIRTNALVPDQGTVLLGGLKLAGENEVEAGVPVLSKIPVLKRAFTNRSRVKDEQIVLVLVKPTIMIPQEQEDMAYPDLVTNKPPVLAPAGGG